MDILQGFVQIETAKKDLLQIPALVGDVKTQNTSS
jgi:hypothetical protein